MEESNDVYRTRLRGHMMRMKDDNWTKYKVIQVGGSWVGGFQQDSEQLN